MKPLRVHDENLAKHGVTFVEVRHCLLAGGTRYRRKAGRDVYQVIGQTASGRYLEIKYLDRAGEWFVFHAMDARPRDIRLLKRRGKRQ